MAPAVGLVVVKKFTYRGDTEEEWSNKYWLTGADPGPSTAWQSLFDNMVAAERTCYTPQVRVVGGLGYNDNDPHAHATWTFDYPQNTGPVGTLVGDSTAHPVAGDQAGFVYWQTSRKNSKGKWIYLRKYFHGALVETNTPDTLDQATNAAYANFAQVLADGTALAGGRKIRSQAQDEVLQTWGHRAYITTRTLHRRGKRP